MEQGSCSVMTFKCEGQDDLDLGHTIVNIVDIFSVSSDEVKRGDIHDLYGEFENAATCYQSALGRLEGVVCSRLGNALHKLGRFAEAACMLKRALIAITNTFGVKHSLVALVLIDLGDLDRSRGMYDEARLFLERARLILETDPMQNQMHLSSCRYALALLMMQQQDFDSALSLLQRVLAVEEATRGPNSILIANVISNIAFAFFKRNEIDSARDAFERALAMVNDVHPNHSCRAAILSNYALLCQHINQFPKAKSLLKQAFCIKHAVSSMHPDLDKFEENLAILRRTQSCCVCGSNHDLKRCSRCSLVYYCSFNCQV